MFKLPPVERRRFFFPFLRKVFLPYVPVTKDVDEAYLFFIFVRANLLVSFFFSFLNLISYMYQIKFDFLFFEIYLPQERAVATFCWSYSIYMSLILLIPVNLLYFFMSKFITRSSYDFLTVWSENSDFTPARIKSTLKALRFVGPVGMLISGFIGYYIYSRYGLSSSPLLLFVFLLLYPLLLSILNSGFFLSILLSGSESYKNSKS